jgi:phenylpropionate dioxygenase-like ring-hydroxylating dioxygenase large terminal subunit
MGELMRRYWIPAAMSGELLADGDPVRLLLLGEKLIAFRDTSGRVGVMDHRCPHRCASLFLGRNEHDGIRCVYHGWKFDVTGRCVDMPSVPAHQDFKDRVRAKAYPALERNGLVWVYMGPEAEPPPLPMIEAAMTPQAETSIAFVQRRCNWLQALEGDIDTSHFGFLHAGHVGPDDFQPDHPMRHTVTDRAPEYRVADTDWGTSYGAYRAAGDGGVSWRVANFLFPFWTQAPNADFESHVGIRAWVPMDDEHTMVVMLGWTKHRTVYSGMPLKNGKPLPGFAAKAELLPNGTGWTDRFRAVQCEENDWRIDRDAQRRNEIYTGIRMVFMQDQAVTESMGGISDHAFEHLGPSDQMIARTRRRLVRAARALRDAGTSPPGAAEPEVFWRARSGAFHTASGVDWQAAYAERLAAAVRVPVGGEGVGV